MRQAIVKSQDREAQADEVTQAIDKYTPMLVSGKMDRLVFQALIQGQNAKIKSIRLGREMGRDRATIDVTPQRKRLAVKN